MHNIIFISFLVLGAFSCVFCDKKDKINDTSYGRGMAYRELVGCIETKDTVCFLDVAESIVNIEQASVLAEADKAVARRGRAKNDGDSSGSTHISEAITQLITELTNVVKEGISGFFRDGKDEEEEDETEKTETESGEEDEENEEEDETNLKSRKIETRGKKKKKKIHALIAKIKLLIAAAVLAVKLIILLKIFAAHLQVKFLFIAFAGLVLNAIRFYLDIKKKHNPQKVIYYEHANHNHHYEGGEEDWSNESPDSPYWARAYDAEKEKTAQDIAYSAQKPVVYQKKETPDQSPLSWWGRK